MNILQICHKPPYPAIDGGCIAIKNISEGLLNESCNVKILTINTIKHPFDISLFPKEFIEKTKIESVFVDTKLNIVDAFSNLVTYDSYNISRFFSPDFNNLLIKTLQKNKFDVILLESLFTTPYLNTIRAHCKSKVILRSHNLEHIIWERLAKETSNPAKKVYLKLLSNQLKSYEIAVLKNIDGVAAISKDDELKYNNFDNAPKSITIPFGINLKNYNYESINKESKLTFFHLGAMDWKPNLEAVGWLLKDVWPKIVEKIPNAELHLAGKNMPKWLIDKKDKNVFNHGNVESAKEFMKKYDVMIVPILSAGGIRVKIIEGMALGKTIVSTKMGAEGLNYNNNQNILIANNPEEFTNVSIELSKNRNKILAIGENARIHVLENYDQNLISKKLINFFESI
jgi:glycosyltransferase involved in cell wall biosynthesis